VVDRVRGAPGVADASEVVTSIGIIESPVKGGFRYDGWPLQGVDADAAAQALPVSVTAGSLDDLRGETVALSAHRAAKLRRGVGDEITLRLGDGTRTDLRVVGLFAADRRFETLVLPADLLAAHTTDGLPHQVLVQAAGGTDSDQLVDELTTVVADQPGVRVADRSAMSAAYGHDLQTQTWVNLLLVGMIVAYTSISLVNSLVTTTSERRREFGLQRLVGFTPAQVMRMMGLKPHSSPSSGSCWAPPCRPSH
jgi:putative ABC transport system permease protein